MRTRRPPAAPAARSHASRGRAAPNASSGVRHGLARVLSKAGVCSRSEAARWIAEGRVSVSGRIVRDPEFPIASPHPPIEVDGQPMGAPQRLYLMLNKPRGVVTTAQDERGRDTVYRCFDGAARVASSGRPSTCTW